MNSTINAELRALRLWLMTSPRPAAVHVVGSDDREHNIETKGARWIEVAKTVSAFEPKVIEALDSKGHSLRAIRPDEIREPDEKYEEGPGQYDRPPAPEHTELDSLVVFARLLADAYKHSTSVAFERLANLFDSAAKRADSQQKTIDALMRKRVRATNDDDDDEGPTDTFEQSLMKAVLDGKLQGELAKAAEVAMKKQANGPVPKEDA